MSTTSKPPVRTHLSEIVQRYVNEDWTLQALADEYGVTRQRISQLLIEAGHPPAARRALKRAHESQWRQQRADSAQRRSQLRGEACERFDALSRELGVSPATLGQYAARAGVYAKRVTPRGHQKLPARSTPEGALIALRAVTAASPWAPRHIANLASRRT